LTNCQSSGDKSNRAIIREVCIAVDKECFNPDKLNKIGISEMPQDWTQPPKQTGGNTICLYMDISEDESVTFTDAISFRLVSLHHDGWLINLPKEFYLVDLSLRFVNGEPDCIHRIQGFQKSANGDFQTKDNWRQYILNEDHFEPVGYQKPFLTITESSKKETVDMKFSWHYFVKGYITPLLDKPLGDLREQLLLLASIYLTQVASPETLQIYPEKKDLVCDDLLAVLENAGWFDDYERRELEAPDTTPIVIQPDYYVK
jgi:hypothetical protein